MRSSHLAIRSVFHSRRLTCQVPRKKAVMGMMAGGVVLVFLIFPSREDQGIGYRG
jgi:hypothetical protein